MAFGFSPKYVQDLPLDSLAPEQFLTIALLTAKKLGWNVGYNSESGFTAHTKFSLSSWGEEIKVIINENSANLKSECTGMQVVDWGKNKKNIEKFISTFSELRNTLTTDEIAQKFKKLKPNLISKEETMDFFSIFKPTSGYFITPILINLNLLIFILMAVSGVNILLPDNDSLINWGANFRPVTLEGGWWRLLTSCFLHIGIFHLFMNMYALLYIGILLEPHIGRTRFIATYLLTGITASITSLWWHDLTISAGASGAIFGIYGVFLAMLTTNLIEKSARKSLLTSIGIFMVYNLLNGMKGGIDNAAHIGGLISGLMIGYSFYPTLKKPDLSNLKYSTVGLLAALVLATSFVVYQKIPNDIAEYDKKMEKFSSMEAMALEVYNMPRNAPTEELLSAIKDRGLYYWNENLKLLQELDQMNLPSQLHETIKKLIYYCNLRIKSYNFIYKAIEGNTDMYQDNIDYYNQKIEETLNSLKE
jgi:rhomboid protease GluP